MTLNRVSSVLMAIVGVALVTTLVAHPGTAKDVTAGGEAFANSLRAAEGK